MKTKRNPRLAIVSAMLVAAASLQAAPAQGQGAPSGQPSPSTQDAGREAYKRGQQLSAQGKFNEAYAAFAEGWQASQRPAFLFNMAECARQGGNATQAKADYETYLQLAPTGDLAKMAQSRLAELQAAERKGAESNTTTTPVKRTAPASPSLPGGNDRAPRQVQATPAGPTVTRSPNLRPTPVDSAAASRTNNPSAAEPPPQFVYHKTPSKPLHRQPWFWGGVGVVVAGSLVAGYLLTRDEGCAPPKCLAF